MADIFISYASEDRPRIEQLAKALENRGWSVFWDRTIPAGKSWRRVIGDALKAANAVIVAWSETSIDSRWVQEEADRGLERNILIPVLIDNVRPPLGFGAVQAADLIGWDPAKSSPAFEKLITDISAVLGSPPGKIKAAEQKRLEEERRRRQAAEEKQKAEAQRKAEEDRRRKEAAAKREAEEERKRKKQQKREIVDQHGEEPPIINPEPPPKRTAFTISAAVLLVVLFISVFFYFKDKPPTEKNISSVRATEVGEKLKNSQIKIPTRAVAWKEADLSFRVAGVLVDLPRNVGEMVIKGDILAKIDDKDYELKISQLQADLESLNAKAKEAGKKLNRNESLFKTNAISKSELEKSRKAFKKYQDLIIEGLEELSFVAKEMRSATTILAPFKGIISMRSVEVFQQVKPNQSIVTIQDRSKFKLPVDIPESLIDRVKSAKSFSVHFDAFPTSKLTAVVEKKSVKHSKTTGTYSGTLLIKPTSNVRILPGMAATVYIK